MFVVRYHLTQKISNAYIKLHRAFHPFQYLNYCHLELDNCALQQYANFRPLKVVESRVCNDAISQCDDDDGDCAGCPRSAIAAYLQIYQKSRLIGCVIRFVSILRLVHSIFNAGSSHIFDIRYCIATGKCSTPSNRGVAGKKCDVCQANYWAYTSFGCKECGCDPRA